LCTTDLSSVTISLFPNLPNGTFGARRPIATSPAGGPWGIVAQDVCRRSDGRLLESKRGLTDGMGQWDHDGFKDVAVSNYFNKSVSILLNPAGNGTFVLNGTYSVGNGPEGIASGDVRILLDRALCLPRCSSCDVPCLLLCSWIMTTTPTSSWRTTQTARSAY
jgi:hypothetical protein